MAARMARAYGIASACHTDSTSPRKRGRPPKGSPPPTLTPPSEDDTEDSDEPAYIADDPQGIGDPSMRAKRARRRMQNTDDSDNHDLPDKPPPGWPSD